MARERVAALGVQNVSFKRDVGCSRVSPPGAPK
jgi:hypothetical protein